LPRQLEEKIVCNTDFSPLDMGEHSRSLPGGALEAAKQERISQGNQQKQQLT